MMIKKNITHPKFLSRKFLKDNRGSLDKFTDKTILKELKFKTINSFKPLLYCLLEKGNVL